MSEEKRTVRRLGVGAAVIVALLACLCVVSYALAAAQVTVNDNRFTTGKVRLNLNDGQPVIRTEEFLFEPGMTVEKQFFLQNESTAAVYYRLYLEDVAGDLADVLEVTIAENGRVLYSGTASQLTRANTAAADDTLAVGQRRTLTITFYFPPQTGNAAQNGTMNFRLCAEATQVKNNPDRLFE